MKQDCKCHGHFSFGNDKMTEISQKEDMARTYIERNFKLSQGQQVN